MRLTTKGRYAVTAMLDIALHDQGTAIALADISERQSISKSYLEQLFAKLKKAMLVESVRGPGGGYRLAKTVDDIAVADIISAVDERVDSTSCQGKGNCHQGSVCLTHHLWEDLNQEVSRFLSNISLAELLNRREIKAIALKQDNRDEPEMVLSRLSQ